MKEGRKARPSRCAKDDVGKGRPTHISKSENLALGGWTFFSKGPDRKGFSLWGLHGLYRLNTTYKTSPGESSQASTHQARRGQTAVICQTWTEIKNGSIPWKTQAPKADTRKTNKQKSYTTACIWKKSRYKWKMFHKANARPREHHQRFLSYTVCHKMIHENTILFNSF